MLARLVFRHLLAHPVRSALTVLSVGVAVFLLCLLEAVVVSLTTSTEQASTKRLWVQSAVSLFVDLPLSYGAKIAGVDGVEQVCRFQWFGANYMEERVDWAQFAIDPEPFAPSYPEMEIIAGSYAAFAGNRAGCLVGADLVRQYGWELGGSVRLNGTIFTRADGGAWEFTIEGIYRSKTTNLDNRTLFFQFDYLRESLEQGAAYGPDGAGTFVLAMADGVDATRVMGDVDALFENGPQRVQTTTEAEFQRQFASMLGNVPLLLRGIGGAVLFAIFFAVLNTMLMAGRERTRQTGIMRALGFRSRTMLGLLLIESLLLCFVGAACGLVLVAVVERVFRLLLAGFLPNFAVSTATMLLGLVIAAAVGLVSGAVPGWRLNGLRAVEALRRAV